MSCEGLVNRSSVMAIVAEDTAGVLKVVSSATQFIPLKSGYSLSPNFEELTSDELLDSIGQAKGYLGKENPSGTHPFYLKNSETDGFPEYDPMLLSAFGTKVSRTTTDTIVSSTATTVVVADASIYEVGEALAMSDTTNGYLIRNIASIDSSNNILVLNFQCATAPAAGSVIQKNYMYKPNSDCAQKFSTWLYRANSGATEAVAGCQVVAFTMNLPANQQAEAEFQYEGTKFYLNPINITTSNYSIDWMEASSTRTVNIDTGIYREPTALADHIATKMNAISTDTISVSFNSHGGSEGKYTFSSDGTQLSILWLTGGAAASSLATTLGFDNSDDTGATSYTSDSESDYSASYTPSYDGADNIILKNCDLFIGSQSDNYQRKASNVTINYNTPVTDVDDITSETGVLEKKRSSREVTMTTTILLEKHEIGLFNKYINNTTMKVMVNCGPKDSDGNWTWTKGINLYFANATISSHSITGDDVLMIDLTIRGHVTSSLKDFYLNYL